jgi:anti-sigma factor RsiW
MRCQDVFVLISAALDGELDPTEAASLRQHLQTCETCRQQQQQMNAAQALLDDSLRVPALRALMVPEELRARIASSISRPASPPRRRASPLAFAVAFTGAAAAAAAIAMATPAADSETIAAAPTGPAPSAATVDTGAAVPSPIAQAVPSRVRPTPRTRTRECRQALVGSSPVARACSTGGTREASRVMHSLVKVARARGLRLDCGSCHTDQVTFDLDAGARERFARMLAAIGA